MTGWIPPQTARKMSTKQITDEIDALETQWEELQQSCDGKSGSPGEWMHERLGELEAELQRRRAYRMDGSQQWQS